MKLLRTLQLQVFVSLFSLGNLIILFPDDVPMIVSILSTRLPLIRIGMNNTKVGFGFRVGRNIDWQMLFELGPQDQSKTNNSPKRETNPQKTSLPESTTNFIDRLRVRRPAILAPSPTPRPKNFVAKNNTNTPVNSRSVVGTGSKFMEEQNIKENEIE